MLFIKTLLTPKERLSFLRWAIRGLAQTWIEVYDHKSGESWIERHSLRDRLRSSFADFECAVLGYVYRLGAPNGGLMGNEE